MFNINDYLFFGVHGGGHGKNSFANQVGHSLKNLEDLLAKDSSEIFATLLPGLDSLNNIHPLFVHFPIAFLTAFLLIDLCGTIFKSSNLRHCASVLLYLGTISAILTVAAGLQAAATVAHGDAVHAIMMQHKFYGISVAVLSVLLSFWRFLSKASFGTFANIIHLSLAFITCIILTLGTDLGGLMVYKFGVGVGAVKQPAHHHHHHQNHTH